MDEVEVTSTMSRLLLENMLPKHVVNIILDPKRNKDVITTTNETKLFK